METNGVWVGPVHGTRNVADPNIHSLSSPQVDSTINKYTNIFVITEGNKFVRIKFENQVSVLGFVELQVSFSSGLSMSTGNLN